MRKTKSFRDLFSEVTSGKHLLVDGATVNCTTLRVSRSLCDLQAGSGLEASFEDIDSTPAQRKEREDGREVEDVFARRSTGQDSTEQRSRYPGARTLKIAIPDENPQLTKAVHCVNDAGTCVTPQRGPMLSPTSFLSPYTSHLLDSMACKLMSPCMSVKSEDRNLCARLATIEGHEGIWIQLKLKHSIQTLLDSCGNGRLSWLRVAIRLDLADALGVNPRHLNIISLEENPDNFTIIQMLLNQPPKSDASALSLASVGERLHRQAQSYLCNTSSSDFSTSSVEAPTTQKRSLGCKLASGLELKNRKQVINLLQLIESVEVTTARPVPSISSNWPRILKTSLLLILLASTTYLAAAFDMLLTPGVRDSSASSSRVGFKHAPATHISRSSQRMGSRDGYVTQLRMLDPMTTGDLN